MKLALNFICILTLVILLVQCDKNVLDNCVPIESCKDTTTDSTENCAKMFNDSLPEYMPSNQDFGWVRCMINGRTWEGGLTQQILWDEYRIIQLAGWTISNSGFSRHVLHFGPITRTNYKNFQYVSFISSIKDSMYTAITFDTFEDGGDVSEDFYDLDTVACDNNLEIVTWDESANSIQGIFTFTFYKSSSDNPNNPDSLKVENGEFLIKY